jgi:hypothetical protein
MGATTSKIIQLKNDCTHRVDMGTYWTLFGFDQFVHQLTYVAFLAILAGVFGTIL